jgi:hypothetical protein
MINAMKYLQLTEKEYLDLFPNTNLAPIDAQKKICVLHAIK